MSKEPIGHIGFLLEDEHSTSLRMSTANVKFQYRLEPLHLHFVGSNRNHQIKTAIFKVSFTSAAPFLLNVGFSFNYRKYQSSQMRSKIY